MPPNPDDSYSGLGWAEWKGRIAANVETLTKNQDDLFNKVNAMTTELAYLKGKAAAYGAATALIINIAFVVIKEMGAN